MKNAEVLRTLTFTLLSVASTCKVNLVCLHHKSVGYVIIRDQIILNLPSSEETSQKIEVEKNFFFPQTNPSNKVY